MKIKLHICIFLLFVTSLAALSANNDLSQQEAKEVYSKLLNSTEPIIGYDWPPSLEIIEDTTIYAVSLAYYNEKTDNFAFKIKISDGIIRKIINGDDNVLAFILGHEIAHIKLNHLTENLNYTTGIISRALSNSDEFDADLEGLKIAIDEGYSYKQIIGGMKKLAFSGYNIGSFECLSKEHPPWSDRLSYIDSNQQKLWKLLSTFRNGSTFLSLHQYEPAIFCFQYVVDQFPGCYEAHANIGYAKLMRYIQLLEPDDIRNFNIGHIVTGTFYNDAQTIKTKIRGIDIELWWEAIGALKLALTFKDDQPLVNANLGLAYLVSPLRNIDIGKSTEYFSEALSLLNNDTTLSDQQRASIYINAGVSYYKTNKPDSAIYPLIAQATEQCKHFADFYYFNNELLSNEIYNAIKFNQALLYARKNDSLKRTKSLLEDFLETSDPYKPWWEDAYEKYSELSKKLKTSTKPKEILMIRSNDILRPIVGVKIGYNKYILLSEQRKKIMEQLDSYTFSESTVIPGKNLKKITFNDLGIALLATEYIFAIFLNKKNSPEIMLYSPEFGDKVRSLYVGMNIFELENIVGNTKFTEQVALLNLSDNYRYYIDLGLAVKINTTNNQVEEFVIAQLLD